MNYTDDCCYWRVSTRIIDLKWPLKQTACWCFWMCWWVRRVVDYWATQCTARPTVCISSCLLVWIVVCQKTGLFLHKWTRTHLWLSLGDKKSIWDTYVSEMSAAQLIHGVFHPTQTGRSKPDIVIILQMHSSSGKIRNCLPRRMTVDKTYWSYIVWFNVFKVYTVSVRRNRSHFYSVDYVCTDTTQFSALCSPFTAK
jgi:hypothetical protein